MRITRLTPFLSVFEYAENDCNLMLVGAVTVSFHVEELFAGFGSVWSAVTVAVFETIPACSGIVRIVTVAVAALAIDPSRQVTVPPASEQVPCVVVEDKYVSDDGSVSATVTFVAVAGPLFVTFNV